jgi:hypothetical protein
MGHFLEGSYICLVLVFGETNVSDKRGRTAGADDNLDVRAIVTAMFLFCFSIQYLQVYLF